MHYLRKEHNDNAKQLAGNIESQYLKDKAKHMKGFKYRNENQVQKLHKREEDKYGVKLVKMQKKLYQLEKQVTMQHKIRAK